MKKSYAIIAIILLIKGYPLLAEDARSIVEDAHVFGNSRSLYIRLDMEIQEAGDSTVRGIEIYRNLSEQERQLLIQVVTPPFLRSMKFLQLETGSSQSQQWLATSRGVRRMGSGDGSTRLFDSDFTLDDFSFSDVDEYAYTTISDDGAMTTIRAVPAASAGEQRLLYIENSSSIITRVDYLDSRGELVKQYRVLEFFEDTAGRFPRVARMDSFGRGSHTEIHISSFDDESSIPSRIFHRGSL